MVSIFIVILLLLYLAEANVQYRQTVHEPGSSPPFSGGSRLGTGGGDRLQAYHAKERIAPLSDAEHIESVRIYAQRAASVLSGLLTQSVLHRSIYRRLHRRGLIAAAGRSETATKFPLTYSKLEKQLHFVNQSESVLAALEMKTFDILDELADTIVASERYLLRLQSASGLLGVSLKELSLLQSFVSELEQLHEESTGLESGQPPPSHHGRVQAPPPPAAAAAPAAAERGTGSEYHGSPDAISSQGNARTGAALPVGNVVASQPASLNHTLNESRASSFGSALLQLRQRTSEALLRGAEELEEAAAGTSLHMFDELAAVLNKGAETAGAHPPSERLSLAQRPRATGATVEDSRARQSSLGGPSSSGDDDSDDSPLDGSVQALPDDAVAADADSQESKIRSAVVQKVLGIHGGSLSVGFERVVKVFAAADAPGEVTAVMVDETNNVYSLAHPSDAKVSTFDPLLVQDVGLCFAVAAILGCFAVVLGLPAHFGFLAAGVALGPLGGLDAVRNVVQIDSIGHLGLYIMLFTLGLEFSPGHLRGVLFTSIVGGAVLHGFFVLFIVLISTACGLTVPSGIAIGLSLCVASTSTAMRAMDADHEAGREVAGGGAAYVCGLLAFEDVSLGILASLVPILGASSIGPPFLQLCWRTVAIGIFFTFLTHYVLPYLIPRLMLLGKDLIYLITLAFLFIYMACAHAIGLDSSIACFAAGMSVSSAAGGSSSDALVSICRACRSILGVFQPIWYVSIGMHMYPMYLFGQLRVLFAGCIGVLFLKAAIFFFGLGIFRVQTAAAAHISVLLMSVGEFSFVLLAAARGAFLISRELYYGLVGISIFTLFISPAVYVVVRKIFGYEGKALLPSRVESSPSHDSRGGKGKKVRGWCRCNESWRFLRLFHILHLWCVLWIVFACPFLS